jgi:hypothetical protein
MPNALRAGLVLALATWASSASAQLSDPSTAASPRVPVSALGRLSVSSEFSFGTTFGGGPAQGLQVTRLQYRIGDPLALRVSIGNTFGMPGSGMKGASSPFLEGLDLAYQPFKSMLIQVHYQDIRSPLQYSRPGYGDFSSVWR